MSVNVLWTSLARAAFLCKKSGPSALIRSNTGRSTSMSRGSQARVERSSQIPSSCPHLHCRSTCLNCDSSRVTSTATGSLRSLASLTSFLTSASATVALSLLSMTMIGSRAFPAASLNAIR